MSDNASWVIWVIPGQQIDNPMYFLKDLRKGVNSDGTKVATDFKHAGSLI